MLASKLSLGFTTACLLSGLGAASEATKKIQELKNGDDIKELTMAYDFAVVSFYKPSDEASAQVHKYIEDALDVFNTNMEKGEWEKREVGWFSVNIDTEDEIKYGDEPDQLIMTKTGLNRHAHFRKMDDKDSLNIETFAAIVRELTGEWVLPIEC